MVNNFKKSYEISIWDDVLTYVLEYPLADSEEYLIKEVETLTPTSTIEIDDVSLVKLSGGEESKPEEPKPEGPAEEPEGNLIKDWDFSNYITILKY